MAQTIPVIDQAWEDKFAGATITEGPVAFFQEMPDESDTTQRVYPALAITLSDWEEDPERREGNDGPDNLMQVGVDTGVSPAENLWKPVGTPFRLVYQLHTYAKQFARSDRELQLLVATIMGDHTYFRLPGTAEDGSDEDVWVFRTGFVKSDVTDNDVPIYHKIHTFEILVHLRSDEVTRIKRAEEFRLTFKKGDPLAKPVRAKSASGDPISENTDRLKDDTTLVVTG